MNTETPRPPAFSPAHLFGLAAFSLALPLFLTLAESPEFFLAHGFSPGQIVVFALAAGLGIPAAVGVGAVLIRRVPEPGGWALSWGLAYVLASLAFLPNLDRLPFLPAIVGIGLAFGLGAVVVFAYARIQAVRSFFSLLALAALAYPIWFAWELEAFASPKLPGDEAAATPPGASGPPVIWVLFDEFGVDALLDSEGHLDGDQFPNFERLASASTWFRDATAVAEMTTEAVPAMLTGRLPPPGGTASPTYLSYGENLFTVLHARGYRINAWEIATGLCPPRINSRTGGIVRRPMWEPFVSDIGVVMGHLYLGGVLDKWLPSMDRQVAHFRMTGTDVQIEGRDLHKTFVGSDPRTARFESFVNHISTETGTLHYLHINLPHQFYQFLPSGRMYMSNEEVVGDLSFVAKRAELTFMVSRHMRSEQSFPAVLARQRYLLQVQYVDRLLGMLLDRLEAIGVYDECILVVTADHGISFEPGRNDRMAVPPDAAHIGDPDHARDILKVPFFIKWPGQADGKRVDSAVETVDIVPTLYDSLGFSATDLDGRSLLDEPLPQDREHVLFSHENQTLVSHTVGPTGPGYLESRSAMNVREEYFRPRTAWDRLLGCAVSSLEPHDGAMAGVAVHIRRAERYADVDPETGYVPAYVSMELTVAEEARAPDAVAVALNGRVAAISVPYRDRWRALRAAALVPESAFVRGTNRIELFGIAGEDGGTIAPLKGGTAP